MTNSSVEEQAGRLIDLAFSKQPLMSRWMAYLTMTDTRLVVVISDSLVIIRFENWENRAISGYQHRIKYENI